ncbi:MAG TPA: VWA domain-containing protein [Blastocatellia bacterium]|nr:VWA domain-containing protein [Blastocatellia bacterium]
MQARGFTLSIIGVLIASFAYPGNAGIGWLCTGRYGPGCCGPCRAVRETRGQDQEQTIHLRSDLVSVNAAVTDSSGHSITGLTPDDFVVFEDGVRQKITNFAATEAPFEVMLLLDLSGSTSEEIGLIRDAARNFLGQLNRRDRAGVLAFSGEVYSVAALDDSLESVESKVEDLQPTGGSGKFRFNTNTGTAFYDALYGTVTETELGKNKGRKAIVCVSDGVDSTSRTSYREMARQVEASGTPVYFLNLDTEQQNLDLLLKGPNDPNYANFSRSQIDRYFDRYNPVSLDRNLPPPMIPREMRKKINHGL